MGFWVANLPGYNRGYILGRDGAAINPLDLHHTRSIHAM